MKRITNEEKILQILLDKCKLSKSNQIYVSKTDFEKLNMEEKDFTRALFILQEDGLISIIKKSPHDDLSMSWIIGFKSAGIYYFENKKEEKKENRNNWIQFWIPVVISIIALVVSVITA